MDFFFKTQVELIAMIDIHNCKNISIAFITLMYIYTRKIIWYIFIFQIVPQSGSWKCECHSSQQAVKVRNTFLSRKIPYFPKSMTHFISYIICWGLNLSYLRQICLQRWIREVQAVPHSHPAAVLLCMLFLCELQVNISMFCYLVSNHEFIIRTMHVPHI